MKSEKMYMLVILTLILLLFVSQIVPRYTGYTTQESIDTLFGLFQNPETAWFLIISLTLIIIILIILILIYKFGVFLKKIKGILKEEKLFDTKADKQNLKNYIIARLNAGVKELQIITTLLSQGWTERQINFVLNEIKAEYKKPTTKPVSGYPPGTKYISSKDSNIYHKPTCRLAKIISKDNLICFKSLSVMKGYRACKVCHPS